MSTTELLQVYARRIRDLRRANAEAPETALAPAFQQLLEGLLREMPAGNRVTIVPEYRNPGVGRPDIALIRRGSPPRAFVELKAPARPTDPARWRGHDQRQFERFKELRCWAVCNFTEFRLFIDGDEQGEAAVVPERALRPDQTDARADRAIADQDSTAFIRLLRLLVAGAGQEPVARDAKHLAQLLAHSARLVRGIVRDRLSELHDEPAREHALLQVRQEFRDVLYAHPEAGGYSAADFDELFSAAFAQTLAFGLLLVREGTGNPVGPDAWDHMPAEHPLMRTALRVLSLAEVVQDIGIGFDVMLDTVNSFAPEILAARAGHRDPILYFYEDFLETFDPEARERFGVYYTPVEVVQYMTSALDRVLRHSLNTQGLRDPNVTILDPASGTGTFLLGIAERVRTQVEDEAGEGMAALAMQNLANRMFGFELLVGPYAVAHYRLHHSLRQPRAEGEALQLPRLGVYLADTLAEPGAAAPMGPLGFVSDGIADERREANRIKAEQPILAIIGNPPYRRLEEGENRTLVGDWLDNLWDDLKAPVRDARQGGQLNTFPELSVAFWRWSIWKMFEAENAPRRGIVAFISNRKYLTGWPYAGLRQMMRRRFDRIEIIDLRGDVRRGERAGVEADQGVFNIMVGTAITLAIADGSKAAGELADVVYQDSWASNLFSRRAKLDWLTERVVVGTPSDALAIVRGPLEDMRPVPFRNGEWLSLSDVFVFYKSGMKSGDDDTFVSVSRDRLRGQVSAFLDAGARGRYDATLETYYAYRPLDKRWFYDDLRLLNRPGPQMQSVWGEENVGLYAMPGGTGAGPAVWCHGLLPDYHAFRGSYGGYTFPLHDRRHNVGTVNLVAPLIANLSAAYGQAVAAQDVFDAILCLLSAQSYTLRFAEDLEDVFPHVPFPARIADFRRCVEIGQSIRQIETFSRPPTDAYRRRDFTRVTSQPRGDLAAVHYEDGSITLCANGSGRIINLPREVWDFAVSGYRLVPRWLEGRIGLPVDLALVTELRDICGRIAELLDLFTEADAVLEAALNDTLTRQALDLEGIAANGQ